MRMFILSLVILSCSSVSFAGHCHHPVRSGVARVGHAAKKIVKAPFRALRCR
jgi:hypothetical protein